ELQNADASRARPERLPARCFAGVRSVHDAASAEGAGEDVVFPRRRPLGAQAAELAALVQDSERLGGSVVQIVLSHVGRSRDTFRYFRFQKQLEIELVRLPTLSPLPRGMSVHVARPTRSIPRLRSDDKEGGER